MTATDGTPCPCSGGVAAAGTPSARGVGGVSPPAMCASGAGRIASSCSSSSCARASSCSRCVHLVSAVSNCSFACSRFVSDLSSLLCARCTYARCRSQRSPGGLAVITAVRSTAYSSRSGCWASSLRPREIAACSRCPDAAVICRNAFRCFANSLSSSGAPTQDGWLRASCGSAGKMPKAG